MWNVPGAVRRRAVFTPEDKGFGVWVACGKGRKVFHNFHNGAADVEKRGVVHSSCPRLVEKFLGKNGGQWVRVRRRSSIWD
jgi:hypothetical protein